MNMAVHHNETAQELFSGAPELGLHFGASAPPPIPQNDNFATNAGLAETEAQDELILQREFLTLKQRVENLVGNGDFESAFLLIAQNFERMLEQPDPEAQLDFLLLADYLSDEMTYNGMEHLSAQLDYLTARPGALNPNIGADQQATFDINESGEQSMAEMALERFNAFVPGASMVSCGEVARALEGLTSSDPEVNGSTPSWMQAKPTPPASQASGPSL